MNRLEEITDYGTAGFSQMTTKKIAVLSSVRDIWMLIDYFRYFPGRWFLGQDSVNFSGQVDTIILDDKGDADVVSALTELGYRVFQLDDKLDIDQNSHVLFAPLFNESSINLDTYLKYKKLGFDFASFVISNISEFGENCFILENCVAQLGVKIGYSVTLLGNNFLTWGTVLKQGTIIEANQ